MVTMPELDGVEHRYVDLGDDVTIHVADAGPASGPAVMLVHGFPQNWWEWRALIGPLAADGYRVLCPDLRGAGWSSAPRSSYRKDEMADDLAGVLDRLGVRSVDLVAHDWGGPVAFIMMLRHPEKVTGFFGVNTSAPFVKRSLSTIRNVWRFWYQIPISLPVIGPRVISTPDSRFVRLLGSWVGGGYTLPEEDVRLYLECMRQPGHAEAGSRWYRSFQTREMLSWMRGEYDGARVHVPVRWLSGTEDPVLTPDLLDGYAERIDDFQLELVDGVGHWIVDQRPDLVLDRVRAFLRRET
ncbi:MULTISPECIES: alpha/beta fold hydrolase [Mycobacterium avium complex (MAC)]|jgi:pimeloyl-ACP methyl ester carboxylesterase|uniref:EphF n=6 Tax=Mycobacterium avium complex (MAC) TaxID=120793 RepID=Q73U18_MYCPA|nr:MULTISPECIES: alpha/beta hydrolase [Mycobacterium avium complex (MAC)]ELP44761.1 alpha/beta hydrolase [Mycobacterium avium subsp. paratuberculosis S5]ETA95798.1 epoxide hydrolase [Mycobacterium avium 05-4293]ETB06579.1 epoxide hydrolase [Mycobacterium avium subsp. paratuberculosis 10-4404]ETB08134.1 epoxide hydrolase [Mycobacterium avium subsp. paratuberculosis 10-5864]ETB14912.1 epoxide hydrolase [Mycobacterium avium subsp. paratuberculosis 08-8281]ETB15674.1 epoxide hydrolase [Mycobacter